MLMMMTAWTLCMFNLLGLEVLSSKAVHLRVEVKNPEYARGMTVENLDIQRPKSSALEIYADALSCLWRKAGRSEDALLCAMDPASCASTAACTVARARRGPFRRRLQLRFRCGHLALQHALPEHCLLHRPLRGKHGTKRPRRAMAVPCRSRFLGAFSNRLRPYYVGGRTGLGFNMYVHLRPFFPP